MGKQDMCKYLAGVWTISSRERCLLSVHLGVSVMGLAAKTFWFGADRTPCVAESKRFLDNAHRGPSYRSNSPPFGRERPEKARHGPPWLVACAQP